MPQASFGPCGTTTVFLLMADVFVDGPLTYLEYVWRFKEAGMVVRKWQYHYLPSLPVSPLREIASV